MIKRTRSADKIIEFFGRFASKGREDWANAMAEEVKQIPNDGQALRFTLGCGLAILSDRAHASEIGFAARLIIAICLVCWATAKFYVGLKLIDPSIIQNISLIVVFIASGACYFAAGFSVYRQNMLSAAVLFLCALGINTAMLAFTQAQTFFVIEPPANALWRFAIVSEEYFAWISFAAALITARLWTILFMSETDIHA